MAHGIGRYTLRCPISVIALIVCIVGVVVYALSTQNAKVAEIGRVMFAFGLLVLLLVAAHWKVIEL